MSNEKIVFIKSYKKWWQFWKKDYTEVYGPFGMYVRWNRKLSKQEKRRLEVGPYEMYRTPPHKPKGE
jgi:hypothetical protein